MSWSINFIMNLAFCDENNAIFTCVNRLTKFCRLIACFIGQGAMSAFSVSSFLTM